MKKIFIALALTGAMTGTAMAADVEAGKAAAASCVACHGAEGVSAIPNYPNLAGQKEAYIAKQLSDFKSGARKDPVMSGMAMPLSDADVANLAAYYASLK
ncbi:c-type cytochrome [Thalassotalea aquiviva]|uniref:c-type cytochrome n=1 Tax=Thalassotalea aquiviva TaxID=3242415 RepID=UPI00352B608A